VLTEEELRRLPAEKSREIDVVEFVPSEQLDPMLFEKSYFLEPDGASPKAYVLLRRALEASDRTAIVRFALRQKTRLGALRVRGDVLLLQALLWSDEVREADFPVLAESTKISRQELELSAALVESFANDFTPQDYRDDYQDQLRELIEAKLAAGETVEAAEAGEAGEQSGEDSAGGEVLDLMEALRRSVERSRGGGKVGTEAAAEDTVRPAKRRVP
jgi:DNA end-binding protein Ku